MAKQKKRKDGLVEIKRTINGKVWHFYGKTKREAETKYKNALVEAATSKEQAALFENVAAEWWEAYQKKIKPGTVRAYQGGYKAALAEFSGYRMDGITPGMVNTWGLRFQARGNAGGTARNARSVLSLIFKYWCVRDGEAYNPVPLVDLPRGMKKTERQPPTPAQLAAVNAHPEGFGLCAWLFMCTGCRLGEINALQWQDIDFAAGVIHITKSCTWISTKAVIETPKTKNSVRDVPLLLPLRLQLESRKGRPKQYVLGGDRPLKSYEYRRLWLAYCTELGMVQVDEKAEAARERKYRKAYGGERKRKPPTTHLYKPTVTAHQFRHEMASALYEADVGELEAQLILGHADLSTTRKIYTHVSNKQLEDAADKLNKVFEKVAQRS